MKTLFVRKTLTLLTVLLLFIVSISGVGGAGHRHPGMVDDLRARFAGARHPQLGRSF